MEFSTPRAHDVTPATGVIDIALHAAGDGALSFLEGRTILSHLSRWGIRAKRMSGHEDNGVRYLRFLPNVL
ncbi:hypothetical protein PTKU64_17880 [Paraburkholderia terrae]|uniref:Uncharacterized protein n=1 Tax=Paraburkholderia terrae TaxID=311230 RepID=A0ABM7TT62_9BURK|nr:hypothetical protein PTKU64_17880 [Paraburkholderia terrae]